MSEGDRAGLGAEETRPVWRGGQVLAGRYRLVVPIGEGGMGVVWHARDHELGDRSVAIKALPQAMRRDARGLRRLREEARLAIGLHHPRIVGVNHLEVAADEIFLVMEHVDGPSLAQHLDERSALPADEVIALAEELCDALAYAHARGVIHRDIKPANILLALDGPMLGDFGIAVSVRETMYRLSNLRTEGTLPYMAPEQIRGRPGPSPQTDLYQLAVTLYECLTGEPPFRRGAIEYQIINEPPAPLEGVPAALVKAILRGLEKDPTGRPTSAAEFRRLLREPSASPAPRWAPGSVEPDHGKAQRLLAIIREIHEGGRDVIGPRWTLYDKMRALADGGDCADMHAYYEACLRHPRGRRVEGALRAQGRKTLESEHARFVEVFEGRARIINPEARGAAEPALVAPARAETHTVSPLVPASEARRDSAPSLGDQAWRLVAGTAVGMVLAASISNSPLIEEWAPQLVASLVFGAGFGPFLAVFFKLWTDSRRPGTSWECLFAKRGRILSAAMAIVPQQRGLVSVLGMLAISTLAFSMVAFVFALCALAVVASPRTSPIGLTGGLFILVSQVLLFCPRLLRIGSKGLG